MIYFLRFLSLFFYYIGFCIQPLIKLFNRNKGKRIPSFESDVLLHSATKLVQKLKTSELSSEALVKEYIKRVKAVNPILNAVIEDRFLAAINDAKRADEIIASTENKDELFDKMPLLGIPFTVKECCGVKGLSHVVGSPFRQGIKAPEDSDVVAILRRAGAIPLLVSATPEVCVSWETSSFTHGTCNNPYNTQYTPGGSSGGEGSLNAAGATVFGVGSDFCGSIRIPAMFNGVYGHKPSGYLVSPKGNFPSTQDNVGMEKCMQIGPMTRFAEDLPILLNIMAGDNANKLIKGVDIDDMKIFYIDLSLYTTIVPMCNSIAKSIDKACHHFITRGNLVQELKIEEMNDIMEITIARNMKFQPPPILNDPSNPEKTSTIFTELLKHVQGKPLHTISTLYFQALYDFGKTIPQFGTDYYEKRKEVLESKLIASLGNDGVLLFPTFHRPAYLHNTSIIHSAGTVLTGLFNVLGLPSLHVPMGLDKNGLPIGFQIIAGPYADNNCFKVAAELERTFGEWIPPS